MKIALFGGSFDPIHLGHVEVVNKALEKLDVQMLIVMPAFLNPFKDSAHASAQQRLSWAKRVFSSTPNVIVSDFEIRQNKPTPTIETLMHLYKTYEIETLYIIIGADNIQTLSSWYRYEEILKKAQFVVASRGEHAVPKGYLRLNVDVDISSSSLRKKLKKEYLSEKIAKEIMYHYEGQKS